MKIVVGFDTETTGLKVEKNDRIIEFGMIGYDFDTQQEVFRYVKKVNPNRAIDPKAQLIHGISQADLIGQPEFKEIEPTISKVFAKANLVVAHNLMFDVEFLFAEYKLIGKQLPNVEGFDTMVEGRWATSEGKNPNLGELCYALEVDYDTKQAHGALYDVSRTMACFFEGIKRGGYKIKEFE